MYFLAKMLKDENDITFVLGFRSKSQIILENELKKYGDVFVATDDGSYGYHGNVLKLIEENKIDFDVIYACGPTRMLEALDNRYCGKRKDIFLLKKEWHVVLVFVMDVLVSRSKLNEVC